MWGKKNKLRGAKGWKKVEKEHKSCMPLREVGRAKPLARLRPLGGKRANQVRAWRAKGRRKANCRGKRC